jgi:hypothetical protein
MASLFLCRRVVLVMGWEVQAYTYEAGVHCVPCAESRFGAELSSTALDSEGNAPYPVFASDDFCPCGEWCLSCGAAISEAYTHEPGMCSRGFDNCRLVVPSE